MRALETTEVGPGYFLFGYESRASNSLGDMVGGVWSDHWRRSLSPVTMNSALFCLAK